MKLDWFTVNHYYSGTENIPPSFQTFDVVLKEDAEELERRALKLGHNCLTLQYELDMEHGLRLEAEARIAEFEEKVKSMRNCLNCKHVSSDYSGYQCVNQHDYECEVEGKYDQFWEAK
jgi:hypothetical protein